MSYSFCPQCKGDLENASERDLLTCKECGFHFYDSPKPCNALVATKDDKILFIKRKIEPKKGYLDLPGGFVESGESLEESMVREAREELNVEVKDVRYLMSTFDTYEYQGAHYSTICSFFEGEIPEGAEVQASDDAEEPEFIHINDIPMDKLAFEGIKKVIELYKKNRAKDFNEGRDPTQL